MLASADVSAPGKCIPIYPVSAIGEARPDYLLILPWNFKSRLLGLQDGDTYFQCRGY
jgi:hypothetical protein